MFSLCSELSAIRSEYVLRKHLYPLVVSLVTVIVNRDHYAQKTEAGADIILKRVEEKGFQHGRAQLAVFQARECLANQTSIVVFMKRPFHSDINQFIDVRPC